MILTFTIGFDSTEAFLDHWSSKYDYPSESKYENNIGHPLTARSRLELFEWKNGSVISAKKLVSIATNYPLEFEGQVEGRYLQPGRGGGAIWNIFYAHCLYPDKWPIFDQHVCRAMRYMLKGELAEIPVTDSEKLRVYRESYVPFYSLFGPMPGRRLDKALFMFGRFLKTAKKYA